MTDEMPEVEPIRVVIVDDHPTLRDGVRADLEASGVATVVGEADDGGPAIELVRETAPDVVVMDLDLPTVRGVDAIKEIVKGSPNAKILVLTVSGAESDVLEAVKMGAAGYLLKTTTAEQLVDGVRRVHEGDAVFTPSLAGLVLSEFRRAAQPEESGLTARENEILKLVAKGYTYGEIAEQLYISRKTVQNHVRNILTKLQLRKRYELMRYAIKRGLDMAE
ncbi:MAG TPA: response regulator transcription factor [Actinomycetota bacterium]|nr:response regulator transcription factor [Actinomycetota bacterium]